jgi:hypothetical protein
MVCLSFMVESRQATGPSLRHNTCGGVCGQAVACGCCLFATTFSAVAARWPGTPRRPVWHGGCILYGHEAYDSNDTPPRGSDHKDNEGVHYERSRFIHKPC